MNLLKKIGAGLGPFAKKAGGGVTPAAYRPGRRVYFPGWRREKPLTPEGFGASFCFS